MPANHETPLTVPWKACMPLLVQIVRVSELRIIGAELWSSKSLCFSNALFDLPRLPRLQEDRLG